MAEVYLKGKSLGWCLEGLSLRAQIQLLGEALYVYDVIRLPSEARSFFKKGILKLFYYLLYFEWQPLFFNWESESREDESRKLEI